MTKKFVMIILAVFTIILTVLLVHKLYVLETEQQDFIELAARVADKKQNAEDRYINFETHETKIKGGRAEEKTPEVLQEYQELVLENPDFAGWIVIDDTAINYPVMQTQEEVEYYLHRDFKGRNSYAGTPFVGIGNMQDLQNDIFLYGHNMKNGTMFADLLKFQRKDFWEAHKTIQLGNRYENTRYTVFAVLCADESEWTENNGIFFGSFINKRANRIEKLIELGLYETDTVPDIGDPLLFLVTCRQDSRFVVASFRNPISEGSE